LRVFELPVGEDVRREVRFHMDMKVAELVGRGWTAEAARQEAERLFGDAASYEAECRQIASRQRRTVRRAQVWDAVWQDIRFGARLLLRHPGFTVVAAVTLALGIGANAAVFSVMHALVLTPLPYAEPDRLVTVWEQGSSGAPNRVAEPNYLDWRERSRTIEVMAAYRGPWLTPVLGGADAVRGAVTIVTEDFFEVLRGRALHGRLPEPAEVRGGAGEVAVVSESFWRSMLRAERDLSRIQLTIADQTLPVAAVVPASFAFPGATDVWIARLPDAGGDRTSHNYEVIGRLAAGSSLGAARAEMRSIGESLAREHAGDIDAVSVGLTPLAESLYGSYRRPLALLLGAAALVLLIACTNLASSLLARSKAREREMAVRASVGANRQRLLRQLFTESFMLAGLGGAAGLGLAWLGLAALRALSSPRVLELRTISINLNILLFTLLASTAAAILFGLVPALRAREGGTATVLRTGDRGGSGRRTPLWNVLVAVEVALALVLLVSCGLLLRSFRALLDVDRGFDASGVLAVDVFVPESVHASDTALAQVQTQWIQALRQLPGVEAVGVVSALPGAYSLNGGVDREGMESAYAEYRVASEGYFEALRIPLKQGRLFDESDQLQSLPVVLIDEAFATRFYPGIDPIGRRIRNLRNDAWYYGEEQWLTIAGVVGSVRAMGKLRDPEPTVYVLNRQRALRGRDGVITIRAAGSVTMLATGVRDVMSRLAPNVPFEIGAAESRVLEPVAERRFAMLVVAGFALIALALAAVGIHGVVSYVVERRTREMGIRIALGAVPRGVAGRIVRESMLVVGAGVGGGALASLATARLISGLLVATPGVEPVTLTLVVLLLSGVALLASLIPALRVTRIDPILALRAE
jgi:predicted permease